MSENRVTIRLPALPHPSFFERPEFTMRTIDGTALVSYDPQTQAAFVYYLQTQTWAITAPIDFPAFAVSLSALGFRFALGEDGERWIAACSAAAAPAKACH